MPAHSDLPNVKNTIFQFRGLSFLYLTTEKVMKCLDELKCIGSY